MVRFHLLKNQFFVLSTKFYFLFENVYRIFIIKGKSIIFRFRVQCHLISSHIIYHSAVERLYKSKNFLRPFAGKAKFDDNKRLITYSNHMLRACPVM